MKKTLLIGAFIVVLSASLSYYFVSTTKKSNADLLTSSIKVAQLSVKTRINEDVNVSDLPANVQKSKIKKLLEKEILSYKDVGNTHFDIQEFKDLNYGDTDLQDADTGSAPNAEVDEDFESAPIPSGRVTDERVIVKGDNTAYMLVKDFSFKNGIDYVQYKGVVLEIPKASVPESYEDMKINPDSIYDYVKYQIADGYIDILFESVKDGENVVIRVENNGKEITGYEVL